MEHTRKKWTDESIAAAIAEVSATLGGRFPSSSEMRSLGRNDLMCAITKSGGSMFWSDKLGIQRTYSDSDFGWRGEDEFVKLCEANGLESHRVRGVKSPWDIEVEGLLRVDVKTANFASYGVSTGWFYRLGKRPQADIVVLYQADTGNFYGCPWWICPASNMTITKGGGKYIAFLNNWPLIRQMLGMRMAERARISTEPVSEVA